MGGGFRVPDPEPGKQRRRYSTIDRRASGACATCRPSPTSVCAVSTQGISEVHGRWCWVVTRRARALMW
jgi:hypothetical protein